MRSALKQSSAAGVDVITPHALRHAFASWLAMMGEAAKDIAAWPAHASPETTRKHYAHLRPNGYANIQSHRSRVLTMRSQLMVLSLGETKTADA